MPLFKAELAGYVNMPALQITFIVQLALTLLSDNMLISDQNGLNVSRPSRLKTIKRKCLGLFIKPM